FSLAWLSGIGRRGFTPTTIILVMVAVLFVYNFVVQVIRQSQLESYRDRIAADVAQLAEENRSLERTVTYYESRDYAESVARDQLGYARPGDSVVMPTFPDMLSKTAPVPPASTPTTAAAPPNWLRWWQMLTGK
ncbi:MAG: hypothetical protein RLZZ297_1667, partial [Chloroflexota bacterium]